MKRPGTPAEVALDLIVGSLATYRITRFIIRDSLIDELRMTVMVMLSKVSYDDLGRRVEAKWRTKAKELLGCPYCVSIYIAGATVLVASRAKGIRRLVHWPAMSAGALVIWRICEGD